MLDFYKGSWTFDRIVRNLFSGDLIKSQGVSSFVPNGLGLDYSEKGQVSFGKYDGEFFQEYIFRFPTPDKTEVYFKDGRFFYELNQSKSDILHICGSDTYNGRVLFENRGCWRQFWLVTGPRKNYHMETIYRRAG